MAWDTDMVLMVRVLTNDMSAPQRNTDTYIQQVLVTAGILVDNELEFAVDYTYDITGPTISPDPISGQDIIFQSLVSLKAACLLVQGDFQLAVKQGIKVRDGDSMVDTSVGFRGYKDIIELGPCAAYERVKWDIQSGKASGQTAEFIGAAVMTPNRAPNTDALVSSVGLFFDRLSSGLSGTSFRTGGR